MLKYALLIVRRIYDEVVNRSYEIIPQDRSSLFTCYLLTPPRIYPLTLQKYLLIKLCF